MMPLYDLYRIHDHKQLTRIKTYDKILKRLENAMKTACQSDHYDCSFVVPLFLFGEPSFNITDCMLYLYMKCKRAGYHCTTKEPNMIHVSWRRFHDKKKISFAEPMQ